MLTKIVQFVFDLRQTVDRWWKVFSRTGRMSEFSNNLVTVGNNLVVNNEYLFTGDGESKKYARNGILKNKK